MKCRRRFPPHDQTVLKLSVPRIFSIGKHFCFSVRKVGVGQEAMDSAIEAMRKNEAAAVFLQEGGPLKPRNGESVELK